MSRVTFFLVCLGLSGCLGQQEFLTVNVVPVSTTSVKASFTPPNDTVEYSVQYMFGEGDFTMFATQLVSLDGMGEQTVQLRDPDALPGMLVQVRMNSSLNLTYPITQAWTCNSAPAAPSNVQSFIDSGGFMSTNWNRASNDSGVTQYNMQYRVLNSDDSNQVAVPMETPKSNVSGLMVSVSYEVRVQGCLVDTCQEAQGQWSDWTNAEASPNYSALCSSSLAVGAASFATVVLMLVCALVTRLVS